MQGATFWAVLQPLFSRACRSPKPKSAAGLRYLATELCVPPAVGSHGRNKKSHSETGVRGPNRVPSVARAMINMGPSAMVILTEVLPRTAAITPLDLDHRSNTDSRFQASTIT